MIVKLSKSEQKMLQALDPECKGARNWMKARDIAASVFRKKAENVTTEEIRAVRNAFRKPVREELVEMGGVDSRGQYRIAERGRKILNDGETEFEGVYERGSATLGAKEDGEKRKGQWEKALERAGKKGKAKPKAKAKAKPAAKPAAKAKPAPKKETKKEAPKQDRGQAQDRYQGQGQQRAEDLPAQGPAADGRGEAGRGLDLPHPHSAHL